MLHGRTMRRAERRGRQAISDRRATRIARRFAWQETPARLRRRRVCLAEIRGTSMPVPDEETRRTVKWREPSYYLPALALAFLGIGALIRFTIGAREATIVWMVGLVLTGAPVVWRTLASAMAGHFATDVV